MTYDTDIYINVSDFDKLAARINEAGDIRYALIPLVKNDKNPAIRVNIKENIDSVKLPIEKARARLADEIGNIGIYAYPDGLCFLDIDINNGELVLPQEMIDNIISSADTFTVKTRSGGYQLYFLNDGNEDNPHIFFHGVDAGELRCNWQYVVATGSYVPVEVGKKGYLPGATGRYEVIHDRPFRKFDKSIFPEDVKFGKDEAITKKNKNGDVIVGFVPPEKKIEKNNSSIANDLGMTLTDILERADDLADLLSGPFECKRKSLSEADYATACSLAFWRFSEQQIYTILYTNRFRSKFDSHKNYLTTTISKAVLTTTEIFDPDWERSLAARILPSTQGIERIELETLPDGLPENNKSTLLSAPPRLGKTYWGIQQLIKRGCGIYVANRHSIVKSAIEKFETLNTDGKTAVWVVGKDRGCRTNGGNCQNCMYYPHRELEEEQVGILHMDMVRETRELLKEYRVLTPTIIENESTLCPYYSLLEAKEESDYIFTIPHFITVTNDGKRVPSRPLMVIDEDSTLQSLYQDCLEAASFNKTWKSTNVENFIEPYIEQLDNLESYILQQEKQRVPWFDRQILHTIDKIREASNIISQLLSEPKPELKYEVSDRLNELGLLYGLTNDEKNKVVEKAIEYATLADGVKTETMSTLFEPFMFPNPHMAFCWQGKNPSTLRLIPDRIVKDFTQCDQILVIGATLGELFLKDISGDSGVIIKINKFPYAKNFKIPVITGKSKLAEKRFTRKLIRSIAEDNAKSESLRTPTLVLTATKRDQEEVASMIGEMAIRSTNGSLEEQYIHHSTGRVNVFYQNSVISRGLDIPFYDLMVVDSINFATPYWTAMRMHAEKTRNVALRNEYDSIIQKLIMDETTNSVVRHSPVRDEDETQLKVVFISSRDFNKINPIITDECEIIEINTSNSDLERSTIFKSIARQVNVSKMHLGYGNRSELEQTHSTLLYCYSFCRNSPPDLSNGKKLGYVVPKIESESVDLSDLPRNLDTIVKKAAEHVSSIPDLKVGRRLSKKAIENFLSSRFNNKLSDRVMREVVRRLSQLRVLVDEIDVVKGSVFYRLRGVKPHRPHDSRLFDEHETEAENPQILIKPKTKPKWTDDSIETKVRSLELSIATALVEDDCFVDGESLSESKMIDRLLPKIGYWYTRREVSNAIDELVVKGILVRTSESKTRTSYYRIRERNGMLKYINGFK